MLSSAAFEGRSGVQFVGSVGLLGLTGFIGLLGFTGLTGFTGIFGFVGPELEYLELLDSWGRFSVLLCCGVPAAGPQVHVALEEVPSRRERLHYGFQTFGVTMLPDSPGVVLPVKQDAQSLRASVLYMAVCGSLLGPEPTPNKKTKKPKQQPSSNRGSAWRRSPFP